ncbi:MAG: putative glyoxylase CFP32 [Myxococcota bacterium]|nr:putative glyoxylase CFP32 [Myxococcota bacterium]
MGAKPFASQGRFVWYDLNTSDVEKAKKFYGAVMGWTFTEQDMGGMKYTMFNNNGESLGGFAPLDPSMKGVPSHWIAYCTVLDVDAAAKKAEKLGGKVLVPPMDIPDVGRFCMIADSTGAAIAPFKFVEGREEEDKANAKTPPKVGEICWNELLTNNEDLSGKFASEIFGWTAKTENMGGRPYTTFFRNDHWSAGMMKMPPEAKGAPSFWQKYLLVANCAEATEKVKKAGGKVMMANMEIPNMGVMSVCEDTTGAVFGLWEDRMPKQG